MNLAPTGLSTYWLWPAILVAGIVVLLVYPGEFSDKASFLLHGLCAQNSDHSHDFGGELLPFDARCAGIYAGATLSLVILAARGRLLAMALPKTIYLIVLTGFGGLMALDGMNSLFTDLGWWHPWESSSISRVITGYGMGIAMAVAFVWLFAGTVFQLGDKQPAIRNWSDIGWFLAPVPVVLVLFESGWSWLYVPISIFLIVCAWLVLGMMALATILLATRLDERIVRVSQLHVPAAAGIVVAMAMMIAFAVGRSWLEQTLGIPSTL